MNQDHAVTVFSLEHVHEFDDGHEDVKLIGLYSTRDKAEAARRRVAHQPGFRDHPEGFSISEVTVDQDHWTEGYISAQEALEGFEPGEP